MNNIKNVITASYNYTVTRNLHKTHYEILRVPRNCTLKEIKQSYIELSKKYHPDTSKDAQSHKKFVEVTEAYHVLSKPDLRRNYDLGLPSRNENNGSGYAEYVQTKRNPWNNPAFWVNRDKSRDGFYQSQPYYGIKGVQRVSNIYIVLLCFGFTCIGVGLQILAIRHAFTVQRDKMLNVSNSAEAHLKEVREQAAKNGNKLQLEIMRKKSMKDKENIVSND